MAKKTKKGSKSKKIPVTEPDSSDSKDASTEIPVRIISAEDNSKESKNGSIPMMFTRLILESEPPGKRKTTVRTAPSRKKLKKNQKEIKFDFELNDAVDPMTLSIKTDNLQRYQNIMNINVTDERISLWVEEKNLFGFKELDLPCKIKPQYTVGIFEPEVLKIWLKKNELGDEPNNVSDEPVIWCSSNVLADLETAKKNAKKYQERFHQVQLDYQNLMVSNKREKDEFQEQFSSQWILNILEVMDNFERALEAAKKSKDNNKNLVTGIEMIYKQLESVLMNNGVVEIEAAGRQLDPHRHEVFTTAVNSKVPENTVVDVIQKGYMFNGKVLRLAKVKVAKPKKGKIKK